MKRIFGLIVAGFLVLHCQNLNENPADSGTQNPDAPAAPDDLPQPAIDTVEMSLNGVRHTLVHKFDCKSNAAGIGFALSAAENPTLFLHNADLSVTGNVTVRSGAAAWHMDIDPGPWGTQAAGCAANVVENTATIFELKAVACPIRLNSGTTGTVSFRVRCTKNT